MRKTDPMAQQVEIVSCDSADHRTLRQLQLDDDGRTREEIPDDTKTNAQNDV